MVIQEIILRLNKLKNLIGKTNDTGGTSSAGTLMGKSNALLNKADSIQNAINNNSVDGVVQRLGNTDDAGATVTAGTVMGKLNGILNSSVIKSIQHVTGKQIASQSSNIHPISSVNLSKSIILFEVLWNTRGNPINYSFSGTNITVSYAATGDNGSFGYDAWIVEFN